ncbi:hypothetical protein K4K61_011902 [Colletotrichum sp. SAR11_59]|nr:hypothetical protein K4K61_011902 [Colletotrichum sp. SAR11_59]
MCYWVSDGYYDSIVQLRNATEVFTPAYTTVIRLTRLFCRSPERRKAFEALERKERARVRYEYDRSRGKLKEAHLLWWEKWWIALPVLLDDVSESVCWAIYTNVSFTVYNMFNLIRVLKADEVDASPLKEPKFGQIMPLIMPLIIVLGVFEASSTRTIPSLTTNSTIQLLECLQEPAPQEPKVPGPVVAQMCLLVQPLPQLLMGFINLESAE